MSDLSKISFGGTEYNVKDSTARIEAAKKVTADGGDISNTKIATADSITTAYPIPAAGDTTKGFLGKMKKFCEDIRNTTTGACFIGQIVNNCVTNNAKLPLSAAQGKVLMDLVTQLNADLNDRTAVSDLLAIANAGLNTRRIVRCGINTLNTPYKAGLTSGIDTGTAIISMGSVNYGVIFFLPDGGVSTAPFVRKKTNGVWGDWIRLTTNIDFAKVWGKGTAIPANDDLDNYTTPGSYYSVDMSTTSTLSHVPEWVTTGFRMDVINTTTSKWLIQKIYSHNAHQRVSMRLKQGDGAFLGWTYGITNNDIQSGMVESINCPGNDISIYNVAFPYTFSKAPHVIASLYSNTSSSDYGNISVMTTMITKTGFRIKVANANSGSYAPGVSWIAFAS